MDSKSEEKRVAEDYLASLKELKTISKIEINSLTMIADDNKKYAIQIARCIESHLKLVKPVEKLPILYLIDSICKNHPNSDYVKLFTQNIVSNFCNVFRVSPEKVRDKLHKLRMTWEEASTFPIKKLQAIDEKAHKIDSKWPLLHKPKSSVMQQQQQQQHHQQQVPQQLQPPPPQQPHQQPPQQQTILYPPQPILPMPIFYPSTQPQFQQPLVFNPPPIVPNPLPQIDTPNTQQPPWCQEVVAHQQPDQIQPNPIQDTQPPNELDVTLHSLYGGDQCSNCSLRFDDKDKYAIHLDWHFRQNLKNENMFTRRKWFYPLDLWVRFREINDDVQETTASENTNINDLLISHDSNEIPTAPASTDDEKNMCSVCHEAFEKFWAEEEEEWRLKNAQQHDDERVYHPLCLIDMLQTSAS